MVKAGTACRAITEDAEVSSKFASKSNQITFIVTSPQHKCLGE